MQKLHKEYVDFTTRIKQFPANPGQSAQAFLRFDEGFFWLREALFNADIQPVQPANQDPVPPEPVAG